MKLLESSLDVKLFHRSRAGIEITAQGQQVYDFYVRFKAGAEILDRELSLPKENEFLEVHVGTHEALVGVVWPKLLSEISKRSLKIKPILYTEFSALGLSEKLLNNKLDVLITVDRNKMKLPGIQYSNIINDHYNFFVSPKFKLAKRALKKEELYQLPIIFIPNVIAGPKENLEQALQKIGLDFKTSQVVTTFESVKALIMNHMGIGILPNQICDFEVENKLLKAVKIEDLEIKTFAPHSFSYCYRKTKSEEKKLREFSKLIHKVFNGAIH